MNGAGLMGLQIVIDATQMLGDATACKFINLIDQTIEKLTVVAHDDGRSVESLNGFFQHIFRRHIQMVGRFIENEQIYGLEQQFNHGQSAALASAQHLDALLRRFATKHECPQKVVDFEPHVARGHTVDSVVDGKVLIQQLCLVLCKIANLHVMPHLERAREGNFAHDAFHER